MAGINVEINNGTWELVTSFSGDLPRGVCVKSHADSEEDVEIYVVGMTGQKSTPTEPAKGWVLSPGAEKEFTAALPGGPGLITAIYARSTDALINWAVDIA